MFPVKGKHPYTKDQWTGLWWETKYGTRSTQAALVLEFTRRYPAESCTRIEVTTTDGRRVAAETRRPKGHYRNPLTDPEVETKFRGLASGALGAAGCDRVLAEAWDLDSAVTPDRLFESLVISSP